MSHYLLMCKSLTYAQRTAKILERYGITAIVTKGPQGLSAEGCAYCVKISQRRLTDAVLLLRDAGLGPVKVYLTDDGGLTREVQV
ncbi:MAG: DUF3343 domain-containing protein [Candidatus Heteroscillospira sp.]|jgi:hypothetical protein